MLTIDCHLEQLFGMWIRYGFGEIDKFGTFWHRREKAEGGRREREREWGRGGEEERGTGYRFSIQTQASIHTQKRQAPAATQCECRQCEW